MAYFTKRRGFSALRFIAMAGFLSAPTVALGLTEHRLDCEQQSKRLTGCCGTNTRTTEDGERHLILRCVEPEGCVGLVDVTDRGTIECLEELSCAEVRDLGLCEDPAQCLDRRFGTGFGGAP